MKIAGELNGSVTIEGVGIHTGQGCSVTIEPGIPEEGIVFVHEWQSIPALATNVVDTTRCTRLGVEDASVSTVEHLMSAFAGLNVPFARVRITGPELPVLDGSSEAWAKALQSVGASNSVVSPIEKLSTAGFWLNTEPIASEITVEGKNGSYITATPSDKLRITLSIIYDHPVIGTQTATFVEGEDDYVTEIAPARTFGLRAEVDALLAAGLAKGGSLDNAIVVEEDGYSTPLRFPNELARHKILDLLGDLYLTGSLPRADIIAVKPSHTLNVALAAKLLEAKSR